MFRARRTSGVASLSEFSVLSQPLAQEHHYAADNREVATQARFRKCIPSAGLYTEEDFMD